MRPERRANQRRKMVLPVKVSVVNRTDLAYTMDISGVGARLGGMRAELQPGDTITLLRGAQRAKFRVIWIRQLAPNEFQAGVESLQPNERFWGVDLSRGEREAQENVETLMALLKSGAKQK